MKEKIRAHVLVSGLVQGVSYRRETKIRAEKFGIYGWVKNLEDGRVEAALEGEKNAVKKLIEWMRKGPIGAEVEKLEVSFYPFEDEFKNFEIKYC